MNAAELLNYINVELLHWESVATVDDDTAEGRVLSLLDLRDYVQERVMYSVA